MPDKVSELWRFLFLFFCRGLAYDTAIFSEVFFCLPLQVPSVTLIIIILNLISAQLNMHELRIKKRNKLKNSVLFMLAVGVLINTGVAWTGEDFEGTVANPISSITDESSSETTD